MGSPQKRDPRSMPLRDLTASTASPIAVVAANLMPPEVVAKRRLGWLKRRLGFALAALVVLMGLGYALVHQSTSASRDDLAAAQDQTALLQRRANTFNDILRLQSDAAQIRAQLTAVMTGDLQWTSLLANFNRVAPRGLVVTDVAGKLDTEPAQTATQPGAYTGGVAGVGTLEISGKAKDYTSIATFVDALGRVSGFGAVEPGSLGSEGGHSTFTITATITKAALGGRFATGAK